MTTRRAFLSALAALPVIGRLAPSKPSLAATTDPADTIINVSSARDGRLEEPRCRVCREPIQPGELIAFSGSWQHGPHHRCPERPKRV